MSKVKDTAIHVEILPEEAIEGKRNLLEIELHLLHILKNILSLRQLIKTELKLRKEFRIKTRELLHLINHILSILPIEEVIAEKEKVEEVKETSSKEIEKKTLTKGKRARIDAELREIKRKSRLS